MKYKIDFAKKGKYSTEATVIDEQNQKLEVLLGKELENTMQGTTVEGKLWTSPKNGKVYLFEEKMKSAPTGMKPDFMKKNNEHIIEAQQRKEKSIAAAQDRTAWLWAKNNAVELLKGGDWSIEKVNELATEIYNLEPTKPF